MREYTKNSPQAAARFLVLAALADGDLNRLELAALERIPELGAMGIDSDLTDRVLAEFCKDLKKERSIDAQNNFQLRPPVIARLLADIDDPQLQRTLGRAALKVIGAHEGVHRGESVLICAALDAWDLLLEDFVPAGRAMDLAALAPRQAPVVRA